MVFTRGHSTDQGLPVGRNKFDFNKLFKSGISYQRIIDKDIIKQRVSRQLFELPQFTRSHTHLGTKSTQTLESYVKKVQNFVELAKKDANQTKVLELDIESFALKKQLAKDLYDMYNEQRIIYVEYKKGSSTFTVRKWRTRGDQHNKAIVESKFAEKKEKSIFEKIIDKEIPAEIIY